MGWRGGGAVPPGAKAFLLVTDNGRVTARFSILRNDTAHSGNLNLVITDKVKRYAMLRNYHRLYLLL